MSTHVRTTVDTWQIHVDYGQGFEHEVTEFSFKAFRENMKAYRENCNYPVKNIRRRMKKANMTEHELVSAGCRSPL